MSRRQFNPSDYFDKPAKPYPDFPLFPHANGCWTKKIRGKLHYFGPWNDPDGALAKYLEQKDALHAGRKPRPQTGAATVKDAANEFLNHKRALLDAGELSVQAWADYKRTCDVLVAELGKTRLVSDLGPDDFAALRGKMAQRWGPVRLGNEIQRVRSVFKFALDTDLIDRAVRFGPGFKRPTGKTLRIHRATRGAKLFTSRQVHALMDGALVVGKEGPELVQAGPQLRAMMLLGINCGFGNHDVATLPLAALDLERGWVSYPRPKTGIARRCPLWPETVAALRAVLALRPTVQKKTAVDLVFVRPQGYPWLKGGVANPVSIAVRDLMKALGMHRSGLGFYTLRHTFRTIADEAKDQPAIDLIMGHHDPSMAGHYRERISAARLRAVTNHVRTWLFAAPEADRAGTRDEEE